MTKQAVCSGAFSPHPQSNWLAGWSALFVHRVGAAPASAARLSISGFASPAALTLNTAFLRIAEPMGASPSLRRARRLSDAAYIYKRARTRPLGLGWRGSEVLGALLVPSSGGDHCIDLQCAARRRV